MRKIVRPPPSEPQTRKLIDQCRQAGARVLWLSSRIIEAFDRTAAGRDFGNSSAGDGPGLFSGAATPLAEAVRQFSTDLAATAERLRVRLSGGPPAAAVQDSPTGTIRRRRTRAIA